MESVVTEGYCAFTKHLPSYSSPCLKKYQDIFFAHLNQSIKYINRHLATKVPAMQGKFNNIGGRKAFILSLHSSVRNLESSRPSLKWEMIRQYLTYVQCLHCGILLD